MLKAAFTGSGIWNCWSSSSKSESMSLVSQVATTKPVSLSLVSMMQGGPLKGMTSEQKEIKDHVARIVKLQNR